MILAAAALALGVSVATTQAAPLAELKLIQLVSQRVDALQRRADLTQLGPQVRAFAYIDRVTEQEPNVVTVEGWGLGCGYPDARIVIVVDGIETANGPARSPRPDVNAAYGGYCAVSGNTGVQALVDMASFEPGFNSDYRHTFKIRVYPPAWVSPATPPFPMAESAEMVFYTSGATGRKGDI